MSHVAKAVHGRGWEQTYHGRLAKRETLTGNVQGDQTTGTGSVQGDAGACEIEEPTDAVREHGRRRPCGRIRGHIVDVFQDLVLVVIAHCASIDARPGTAQRVQRYAGCNVVSQRWL